MSTIKINTCDKEWFGRDYLFFNKNGDALNFKYDETLDKYQGNYYFNKKYVIIFICVDKLSIKIIFKQ